MTTTRTGAAGVDLDAIRSRQQGVWASGDFAVIGTPLQIVGEQLCEAMDVAAGWRVLEVAAGHGNAALAAARRGCEVTATDYVPELLGRLVVRAAAEGLQVQTQAADAEALPFPDAGFDAVISTFGVHRRHAASAEQLPRDRGHEGQQHRVAERPAGTVMSRHCVRSWPPRRCRWKVVPTGGFCRHPDTAPAAAARVVAVTARGGRRPGRAGPGR